MPFFSGPMSALSQGGASGRRPGGGVAQAHGFVAEQTRVHEPQIGADLDRKPDPRPHVLLDVDTLRDLRQHDAVPPQKEHGALGDRKSTRLNSSH